MKLTIFVYTALELLTIAPALACLEATGSVSTSGNVDFIRVTDNGAITCNSDWGWRIDQDNHISLSCLSGYIYAVTKDGSLAWYQNPVNAYSFTQSVSGDLDEFYWDQFEFC